MFETFFGTINSVRHPRFCSTLFTKSFSSTSLTTKLRLKHCRFLQAKPVKNEDSEKGTLPLAPALKDGLPETNEITTAKTNSTLLNFSEILFNKLLRSLSSLPLAIGTMFAISILTAIGTVLEQGESVSTYMKFYPEDHPLLGFITWKTIISLSFDHIYSSPLFLGLVSLLSASLIACTKTRQWPVVKISQRWSFVKSKESLQKLELKETLENARLTDVATVLSGGGFQVFLKDSRLLYGFKGLAGRMAPIGVHVALLLIIAGGLYTSLGGYRGSALLPEGSEVFLGDIFRPNGALSFPSDEFNIRLTLKDFRIEYRDDGKVKQFYSDMSLVDLRENEIFSQTISVNTPLRYNGVTVYQTDWAVSGAFIKVLEGEQKEGIGEKIEERTLFLPMASLVEPDSDQKLFGTFLPLETGEDMGRRGVSILASDLQTVVFYDSDGKFVGVRRPGSGRPITVEGLTLTAEDLLGSSGVQVKIDPSVPIVYTGFAFLMLTSAISFLSHCQVWAIQEGNTVYIGGKSNRAKADFKKELDNILDFVPEIRS